MSFFLIVSGEHIDYCGYAVLPMAVEQDIIFAVTENKDGKFVLVNANSSYK
jgi:N-acetylgalactosamine kinase